MSGGASVGNLTSGPSHYDDRSHKLMLSATSRASGMRSDHVGTEHFLLAALTDQFSISCIRALAGATEIGFAQQIRLAGPSSESFERSYSPPVMKSLTEALGDAERVAAVLELKRQNPLSKEAALALSQTRDQVATSPEDILARMLLVRNSFAAVVARNMGFVPSDVAAAVASSD